MKTLKYLFICTLFASASVANAAPLVKKTAKGFEPGVVEKWTSNGIKVDLQLKSGTSQDAIVALIKKNIPKAKTKIVGGKVCVTGKKEAELLPLLAAIEYDADATAALELAALDQADTGAGSSLRAKTKTDVAKTLSDRETSAIGTVVSLEDGTFPIQAVKVQILRGPTKADFKSISKGKEITFVPVFVKKADGTIDYNNEGNQENIGAWYLKAKDSVTIKVGKSLGPDRFEALVIVR